jgi:hypothetical protein
VPNTRTMVTEVGTGLGMLGHDGLDAVLAARPTVMRSLSPEHWDQLALIRAGGGHDIDFHAAWENGRAFLAARDGLRGRVPEVVEWKGTIRAPGDEVAPVDLRVDHVYLISCKYLSSILFNVSPAHVFDHLLVGGASRRSREATRDWYAEVAPDSYQQLYEVVRDSVRADGGGLGAAHGVASSRRGATDAGAPALPGLEPVEDTGSRAAVAAHSQAALSALPRQAGDLSVVQRAALGKRLAPGWPAAAKAAYEALSEEVAEASAARWRSALSGGNAAAEAMLWRLLRMGATPYFVLGSSATQSLRLRIATSWDWRQLYRLQRLEVFAQRGGQPRVGWNATVRSRTSAEVHQVSGHVEVRWSHGRFGGLPEAKGYLDTAHHQVPGYFPLQ